MIQQIRSGVYTAQLKTGMLGVTRSKSGFYSVEIFRAKPGCWLVSSHTRQPDNGNENLEFKTLTAAKDFVLTYYEGFLAD